MVTTGVFMREHKARGGSTDPFVLHSIVRLHGAVQCSIMLPWFMTVWVICCSNSVEVHLVFKISASVDARVGSRGNKMVKSLINVINQTGSFDR